MEKEKEAIPDEVLVVAAILGDLNAFDELVIRYRSAVLRVVTSIVGREYAQDVAQEAWLLAFKSLPSVDNPQKFASWLMVIAKNRALRQQKQESLRKSRYLPMDAFLLEQFSALTAITTVGEEEERVRIALDKIPEDYSIVMRMRFYDGMPLKHIASFLDVPLSTIKWRIFHGKALLLDQIRQIEQLRSSMEKSIKKLVYMLHQVMHDAGFALLSEEGDDTRRFIVEQYNNIRTRLNEIDRELGARFEPLPGKATPGTVRIAARDMAGFLIEYLRDNRSWSSMALVPGMAWFFSSVEQNG